MALAAAFEVGKGIVRVDETNFPFAGIPATLNLTDSRLSIGFTLVELNEEFVIPQHVTVSLSGPLTSFKQFLPTTLIQEKVFEAAIPISNISPWILSGEYISVEIITGDLSNPQFNSHFSVSDIKTSPKLRNSIKLKEITKHEPKPEIFHTFRTQPKSTMSVLISQFMFEISVSLAVLIGFWLHLNAWNIENVSKVSFFTYPFIITLFSLQFIIFDYYKQASIFQTIARTAIITPFAIYFGSKSLRSIYKLQTAGLH